MSEQVVHDWLSDYATLSPVEVHSFASSLQHNDEIVGALYTLLEERTKHPALVDAVCDQLFGFYRSREQQLQHFTLQFLPTLIFMYLNSVAHGDKKSCRSVETLLIGMYNLEIVDEKGEPVVISFRLPSLAQASIYHEPMSLAHASLTETALRRLEECNTKLVKWGPMPPVEALNAQNRLKVMAALMFVFNKHIGMLHKTSLKILCKASSRYNDVGYLAVQSIDDVYARSCFECYPDVILVANAIKNSTHFTSAGQPSEGPMGISVAISPATTTVTVSKSMITNASFRTKKLPDDIPIVPKDEHGGGDRSTLMSISEEKEDDGGGLMPRGSSLRGKDAVTKNLQKLGIGKKSKEGKTVAKSNSVEKGGKGKVKSPLVHNGDSVDGENHSPQAAGKKRASVENGPVEISNGTVSEAVSFKSSSGFMTESQSGLTSDSLDSSIPLDEEVRILDSSPGSHAKLSDIEDKPFMQVSSV